MSAGSKGKRVSDITEDRLAVLNSGTVEATTLTECLAVDFAAIMAHARSGLGPGALETMQQAAAHGISRRMALAGDLLHEAEGLEAVQTLRFHQSDTVRGWACFVIGADKWLGLAARLALLQPLADDVHFGVREWAWMALRPHLTANLEEAIDHLALWTSASSERLRRFASEATRPRGVWCAHIDALKQRPEIALPILEPLKDDPSAYVQDSVGNWLNDASKTRPRWVQDTTDRWTRESQAPATARICKRALRSLTPKK